MKNKISHNSYLVEFPLGGFEVLDINPDKYILQSKLVDSIKANSDVLIQDFKGLDNIDFHSRSIEPIMFIMTDVGLITFLHEVDLYNKIHINSQSSNIDRLIGKCIDNFYVLDETDHDIKRFIFETTDKDNIELEFYIDGNSSSHNVLDTYLFPNK